MPHLEKLPDHHRLEHRSDSPESDDEGVGGDDELVEPGEGSYRSSGAPGAGGWEALAELETVFPSHATP